MARRRNKHWHQQTRWSVYIILLIGAILSGPVLWAEGIRIDLQVKDLIEHANASQGQVLAKERAKLHQTEEENQLLRDKLTFSQKQAAPETMRSVVRLAIHRHFPQSEWANAEAVFTCESGLNMLALNDRNTNGSTDRGPGQINSIHAQRFEKMYGVSWEIGAHDPNLAMQYSRFLWDHSGWNQWVCRKVLGGGQ